MPAAQPREHQVELFAREGLLQKIDGPPAHSLNRILHAALRSKNDDRQSGLALEDLIQDVQAVLRAKIEVQQHRLKLLLLQPRQTHRSGTGRFCVMAFTVDEQTGRIAESLVVVDD